MDKALKTILGNPTPDKFPITNVNLQIDVLNNTAASITLQKVLGICKGILWGQMQGSSNDFVAIPLCYIFSANNKNQ
ncbi:hypothetical protein ACQQ2T_10640 [Paraclostridium tenue]